MNLLLNGPLNSPGCIAGQQVQFPERAGALRKFLTAVSPKYNITLFHYRKSGNRASGILLGIQLPPAERAAFAEATAALGSEFSFSELSGTARDVFEMFIS